MASRRVERFCFTPECSCCVGICPNKTHLLVPENTSPTDPSTKTHSRKENNEKNEKKKNSVMFYRRWSETLESRVTPFLWNMMKRHTGGIELPGSCRCLLHNSCQINELSLFFFCVNCAAAHCIFSVVMVHLTIPAAANRWRDWVRPGRRLWGRSRYFHGSEKQKSRGT